MNTADFTCARCGRTFTGAGELAGGPPECPECRASDSAPQMVLEPHGRPVSPDDSADPAASPSPLDFSVHAVAAATVVGAPPQRSRRWTPLLLIFLVPYALVATGTIAYLIWRQSQRAELHPLEMLPDPKPEDGGPRQRVKHDLPLPDKLKAGLGQPFRVEGFVEVTALGVELAPDGEQLTLLLRFRNLSDRLEFNPLPQSFLTRDENYSFLEFGNQRLYGGTIQAFKPAADGRRPAGAPFEGVLGPGEEMVAALSTLPDRVHIARVKNIVNYRGPLLWRIQIRRGLEDVAGRSVSATMVLGITFDARDALAGRIEDARGKAAGPADTLFAALFGATLSSPPRAPAENSSCRT
jgi:hypothetical protein